MSLALGKLRNEVKKAEMSSAEIRALRPDKVYDDGRTKQSFRDETDINKIMARADVTGTISHLSKYEGVYADFSDFDFHEQSNMLARGGAIFDALPAEIRSEFRQSAAAFFEYVNNPENRKMKDRGLPALAKPGRQNIQVTAPDADAEKALVAASEALTSKLKADIVSETEVSNSEIKPGTG